MHVSKRYLFMVDARTESSARSPAIVNFDLWRYFSFLIGEKQEKTLSKVTVKWVGHYTWRLRIHNASNNILSGKETVLRPCVLTPRRESWRWNLNKKLGIPQTRQLCWTWTKKDLEASSFSEDANHLNGVLRWRLLCVVPKAFQMNQFAGLEGLQLNLYGMYLQLIDLVYLLYFSLRIRCKL